MINTIKGMKSILASESFNNYDKDTITKLIVDYSEAISHVIYNDAVLNVYFHNFPNIEGQKLITMACVDFSDKGFPDEAIYYPGKNMLYMWWD